MNGRSVGIPKNLYRSIIVHILPNIIFQVSPTSNGSVRCIASSPSGKWIAVGLSSGQLTILDGRTGLLVCSWRATDSEILQLIAPNENQLISSSLDNNISVWSSLDGTLLYNLKYIHYICLVFFVSINNCI